jgi:hypothetical protein
MRLGGAGGVREETSSGLRESQGDAGGPAQEGPASETTQKEDGELPMRLHSIRIEGRDEITWPPRNLLQTLIHSLGTQNGPTLRGRLFIEKPPVG